MGALIECLFPFLESPQDDMNDYENDPGNNVRVRGPQTSGQLELKDVQVTLATIYQERMLGRPGDGESRNEAHMIELIAMDGDAALDDAVADM